MSNKTILVKRGEEIYQRQLSLWHSQELIIEFWEEFKGTEVYYTIKKESRLSIDLDGKERVHRYNYGDFSYNTNFSTIFNKAKGELNNVTYKRRLNELAIYKGGEEIGDVIKNSHLENHCGVRHFMLEPVGEVEYVDNGFQRLMQVVNDPICCFNNRVCLVKWWFDDECNRMTELHYDKNNRLPVGECYEREGDNYITDLTQEGTKWIDVLGQGKELYMVGIGNLSEN